MRRLTAEHYVNEMDRRHPAAYRIEDGEQVIVETLDCEGGMVGRDGVRRPGEVRPNPATGPIEVKGVRAGEGLAVTVHEVRPAEGGFISGGGERTDTVIEMKDGVASYPWGLRAPVDPMIGVIGLAPARDPVPTNTRLPGRIWETASSGDTTMFPYSDRQFGSIPGFSVLSIIVLGGDS